MSFEDLLKKKLGPMRDLVSRPSRSAPPEYDPENLYFRRAVGLEVRMHPEDTFASLELGRRRSPEPRWIRMKTSEAQAIVGLTEWTTAAEAGIDPAKLWSYVEQDLLFFATYDPAAPLTGRPGQISSERKIARRASAWPTAAIETAIQIAPMPFMPRGRDLAGAQLVGFRFASLERGFEVLGVTITGERTGRVLRRLLPLLNGVRTAEEIIEALPGEGRSGKEDRAHAKKLLWVLDGLTLLSADKKDSTFEKVSEPQVTWLGHAGVLVQTPHTNVLIDPLFFSMSEPEVPLDTPKFDPRALPRIDAVFITHGDNDHLNPNSLAMLPTDTPIYIPRVGGEPEPYQVDIGGMLSVLGFSDIYQLDKGVRATVGERGDIRVTAYPFVGESWGLDLAKLTYLVEAEVVEAEVVEAGVEAENLRIFCSADAAKMDETYRALAERPIDLAFMGVSGCAESYVMPQGFGYGNFYRDWVPAVQHNEWVQHCAGPKEAFESLALFQPRFAFGYAAGGASFIRTEYSDVGDHAALEALLLNSSVSTKPFKMPLGRPVLKSALEGR